MIKKLSMLLLFLGLALCSAPLFGGGAKETKGQPVNGLENWDYQYDIKGKPSGKYNLIIEGKDKAGNVSIAGPFNVWIDPDSDIPIVAVNNPIPLMRVGNNLNIVGTCVDDVAVDHVEIQLDNGEALKANGTEFWSYYLPVKDIPDGRHTITVRGFDNNQTPSKPVVVAFNLDKFKPELLISSHENGYLASGRIKLKGNANDANGISKVWFSADNGKNFQEIGFNQGKDGTSCQFEFEIDTQKFPDGPQIIWLRSRDLTGSVGISAFLLFVDNTKPTITILRPLAAETVNGKVSVAGMVKDVIGIKEFSWSLGNNGAAIPLVPGNPFFSQIIDLSAVKDRNATIKFKAVDTIGNITELNYQVTINQEADLPVLEILDLKDKAVISPKNTIAIHARDDDGIKAVHFLVDGKEEGSQACAESAIIALPPLSVGPHKLSFWAEDINGTMGKKLEYQVTVKGDKPLIRFDQVKPGASPTGYLPDPLIGQAGPSAESPAGLPFVNGIRLLQDGDNRISGSINLPNPLKTAEYSFDGKTWLPLAVKNGADQNSRIFEIIAPKDLRFGIVNLQVRVRDNSEQEASIGAFFLVLDYRVANAAPSLVFYDQRVKPDAIVNLGPNDPLVGRFVGATPVSVRLQPPSSLLTVSLQGSSIIVSPQRDGITPKTKVIITTRERHEFASEEMVFKTDQTLPELVVSPAANANRVKDKFALSATATDAGGLAEAAYSLDGAQTWKELPSLTGTNTTIKQSISLEGITDGPVQFILRVRDQAGNANQSTVFLLKDQAQPQITIESPPNFDANQTAAWGKIDDVDAIDRAEYRLGNGSWEKLNLSNGRFALSVPSAGSSQEFSVRAFDRTGNQAITSKTITAAATVETPADSAEGEKKAPPKPKLRLLSPTDSESLNPSVPIVVALDNWAGAYTTVHWTLEGQKTPTDLEIPASGIMVLNPDLSAFKGNQVSVNLVVEGGKNRENLNLKLKFDSNLAKPLASIPWITADNRSLAMYSRGDNQAKEIHYTIDGKNETTIESSGVTLVNPPSLAPGKHVIAAWVIDAQGLSSAKLEKSLTIISEPPLVRFGSIGPLGADQVFLNGMDISIEKSSRLALSISQAAGLKELSFAINGQANQKLSFKTGSADIAVDIPLSANLPWGKNTIAIQGLDSEGRSLNLTGFFYRVAKAGPDDAPPLDHLIVLDRSNINQQGQVSLSGDTVFQASYIGRPIGKVSLEPASPDFQVEFSGQNISIKGLKASISPKRKIVVSDIDGDTWKSEEFDLVYLSQGPQITLAKPDDGSWLRDKLEISGTVQVDFGQAKLEYAWGDQEFVPIDLKTRRDNSGLADFTATIDITKASDGTLILSLKATDQSGNATIIRRAYSKDSTPPTLSLITPPENTSINGLTTIVGRAEDQGKVLSVEFSSDYKTWTPVELNDLFKIDVDFSKYADKPYQFWFRSTDASGNSGSFNPVFAIDLEGDKPVIKIQTPTANEVLRNDFKVSGIAYDDDGIKSLYYRLDYKEQAVPVKPAAKPSASPPIAGLRGAPAATPAKSSGPKIELDTFTKIEGNNSFTIPLRMLEVGDNEHKVEVIAEDIYGNFSNIEETKFRISTAEPSSQIQSPAPGVTSKGIITMKGSASDNNGVASVWLSFDNGSSFVAAIGAESWSYQLDTSTLRDGSHVVIIKSVDKYDTEGLYTTLITVDNTPPQLNLDNPRDGDEMTGTLRLSGRISDNLKLDNIHLTMLPADDPAGTRKDSLNLDLENRTVLQQELDISKLPPGWYTLRIEARDHANNLNWISRDIKVVGNLQDDKLAILYPLEGETISGNFSLSGRVESGHPLPATILLSANGKDLGEFPLGRNGYFNIPLNQEQVGDGPLSFVVKATMGSESAKSLKASTPRNLNYQSTGYWVRFDQVQTGDYLTKRPFIKGKAGYYLPPVDKDSPDFKAYRQTLESHQIDRVEISLDHGVSWNPIGATEWQYRVETQNFPNGELFLLVRVIGRDGSMALSRAVMVIDKTPPVITVLKPSEESRFNDKIAIYGTASDNYDLDSVTVDLRQGDKANYAVPSFIQGLYLDGHFLGASTWEVGVGLTFFDDNVKLQANFGQAPAGDRFDGFVLGAKIIANIAYIPFSWIFGPDWDFFSMSFGLGAQFDYFTMSGAELNFNKSGVVLGSAILQWEFARFHFADWTVFRTISLYTEEQLWFISSDVQAGISFKTTFGLRVSIF